MKLLITKTAFIILCLLALCCRSIAQKRQPNAGQERHFALVGKTYVDTTNSTPEKMEFYHKQVRLNKFANEHFYFNWLGKQNIGIRFDTTSKSKIYEGLKQTVNGREFSSILIDGTTSVEVIIQNIQSEPQALNYLYRVVKNNNQELIGWRPPFNIKTLADGTRYAYLGKFDYTPGQFIKVEIYNIKNFREQDAVFIDWRKIEKAKVDASIRYVRPHAPMPDYMLLSHNFNDLHRDSDRHIYYEHKKIVFRDVPYVDMIETREVGDAKFRLSDSLQSLAFNIGKGDRLYYYRISLKRNIDGKTDSLQLGESNSTFELFKEYWKSPGVYNIIFTPKILEPGGHPVKLLHNLATDIKFTVLPPLNKQRTVSLKTLGYILVILLTTGGFMFMMYRDSQKRKLKREEQNRQIASLQLQSVRAQLNPHFIFNALAGIQNLMNKSEVENANKYLSKFARLTRNVLDDANNELTSIEHETDLLNDYLLMEQMRFGFKFSIAVDEKEIDQQIEIPAMLLQPFVENAVKHGVSALGDKGKIDVAIIKTDATLVLSVTDNGNGFGGDTTGGMGMKLCADRIKLLNSIYKTANIVMHKASNNNGTLITIELQNWL
ncbi:two-component system LytT family sensor kinase [Mucilaginibacter sp. UYP25]|uniref:sensor histidine kinase n=1 Tax=unclassified Mucilaginibacter TaxID=2617802 RepID=UPI003395309D